ncbi:MAG: hypothetical protein AAF408_17705 [Pseudomonadota bacterium]
MKSSVAALTFCFLVGCATQDLVAVSPAARFSDYPDDLFAAFEMSCAGPSRSFTQPNANLYECREYMPPGATAAAILEYDGHPEDLPQLVIRFRTSDLNPDVLVKAELFLNVPQKEGLPKRIAPADRRLTAKINRLFAAAGGTPVESE